MAEKTQEQLMQEANKDMKKVFASVEEMIDTPFYEFSLNMEGKNIGELMAFRALFQKHLDEIDVMGKKLVESNAISFNKESRIKLGSVFAVSAKIQDRMGYIDYLVKKNRVS